MKSKNIENINPNAGFEEMGRRLLIGTLVITFLIFSTVNTSSFVAPKSFFLKLAAYSTFIYYIMAGGFRFKKNPLNFPMFCYAGAMFFALLASGNVHVSILRFSEYLSYFLIFLLTLNFFDIKSVKKIPLFIVYSSAPILLYGLMQYMKIDFAFWDIPGGRMDMFSTIGNVNWYGAYLSGLLPLAVYFMFDSDSNGSAIKRTFFRLTAFFTIFSIIITYSRTAFLAMIISFIAAAPVYVYINRGKIRAEAVKRMAAFMLVIVIIGATFSFYNYFSQMRFQERGFFYRITSGFSLNDHNVAQRLFVWRVTLEMFRSSMLWGLGPGMFKVDYLDFQKKYLDSLNNDQAYDQIAGNAKEAHNEYLQMAAETGIVGLAAMLYFFASVFFMALRHIMNVENKYDDRVFALCTLCALTALLTTALADFPLHIPCNAAFIFVLCGVIGVFCNRAEGVEGDENYAFNVSGGEAGSIKFAFTAFVAILIIFTVLMPFAADYNTAIGQTALKEHNFKGAIPSLERAISLNPAQGDALYLLGTAYLGLATPQNNAVDMKKLQSGADLLMRAKKYASDKGIYNNLGFIAMRKKDYDQAVIFFEKALGCDPISSDSLNNLGNAYFNKGALDKAEFYYKKTLKYNEYFLTAINNLGDLYARMKKNDEAVNYYVKALSSDIEKTVIENQKKNIYNFNEQACMSEMGRAAFQIGEIRHSENKIEEALKYYIKAAECIKGLPQIALKIGIMNVKLGKKEEGARYLNEIISKTPPESEYYKQAAEYLGKTK